MMTAGSGGGIFYSEEGWRRTKVISFCFALAFKVQLGFRLFEKSRRKRVSGTW